MRILLLVLAVFFGGCATKNIYIPICEGFFYIYPSKKDTLETKRQVLTHNQTYKSLCADDDKK